MFCVKLAYEYFLTLNILEIYLTLSGNTVLEDFTVPLFFFFSKEAIKLILRLKETTYIVPMVMVF